MYNFASAVFLKIWGFILKKWLPIYDSKYCPSLATTFFRFLTIVGYYLEKTMHLHDLPFQRFQVCLKGMWYLRKVANSYEQFGPVSTCFCPKYIKCCFQNSRNSWEDNNRRRWTTFGFDNGNKFECILLKMNFFQFRIQKWPITSVFIFLNISENLKTIFYVLWTKTCRNVKYIQFSNVLSISYPLPVLRHVAEYCHA